MITWVLYAPATDQTVPSGLVPGRVGMPNDEQRMEAKEILSGDLTRPPEELLIDIVADAQDKGRSGDQVVIDMVAKFSTLLVVLGRQLDKAQKTIASLTKVILILTVVLTVLTAALAYLAYVDSSSVKVENAKAGIKAKTEDAKGKALREEAKGKETKAELEGARSKAAGPDQKDQAKTKEGKAKTE